MHDPPAPVLGGQQMAPLAVHQTCSVEQSYCDGGNKKQRQQRTAVALYSKRGSERAPHHPEPEQQSAKQENLPEASQIDVFVALSAEPEPEVPQLLLDSEPFTSQRADYYDEQRGEQQIDEKSLTLWFCTADCRRYKQSCCEPRCSYPEDA